MKIFTVISTVIALFFAINTTFAQEKITVSGNVTDQHGDVMIGCSVIEKHSTTGTITDFDGNYSIETETGKTLVFSYIGYKNQEIEVTNAKIDVVLEEDLLLLDNDFLIYCCFPTTKAKPFEIQSLNDEKIFQKSPTDFTKAMLGEFAGLQVINSSGQTGIPSDIYIRGINSLYASTAPVFVLDGMVYKGDIAAINPADIYSISVRKNVLDMSYFGLQASNGIVEIITKKGVSYKPKFNIDVKFGLNFAPQRYETIIDPKTYTELGWQGIYTAAFMNGQNHEQAANFANQNLFSGYGVSPQYNPFETDGKNLINPVTGKMFDDVKYKYVPEKWTDYLLHTGKRYEANASLAGGSKIVDYYASFGFLKDNGYFQKADYQRISTLANFNFHPAKWINIDLNVAYTNSTMNNPLQGYYGTNKGFVFINGIPPIYPVFKHDADGAKTDEYDYGDEYYRGFGTGINPVAELQTNKSKTTAHNLVVNSAVKFLLPKGFSIILNNGFVINKSIFNKNIVVFYEISDEMQTNCNNAIYQQTVKYEKNLGYLHNVDIAAGQELSRIYLSEKSIKNSNSPMQDFNFNSSNQMTERIFAYAKYNFNTKYFFEATTSFDRNSDLTTENKMFNSWAVGGAWLIGNEHFMRNIKNWLNELKLNISYGATGNVVKKNDNKYYIKPEKSEIFNAGVSFGIKHFLNVNVDIYNRKISSLWFYGVVYAPSLGFASIVQNGGSMCNRGVDVTLSATLVKKRDIEFIVRANANHNRSKMLSLPTEYLYGENREKIMFGDIAKGHAIDEINIVEYAGVDRQTGEPLWYSYRDKNNNEIDYIPNVYYYLNERGEDGELTHKNADLEKIITNNYINAGSNFTGKKLSPDVFGGFGFDIFCYGFQLNATFAYQIGGYNYDIVYMRLMGDQPFGRYAWHKNMLNAWNPLTENYDTDIPRLTNGWSNNSNYANAGSTRFLASNSALQLANITFGYKFKPRTVKFHLHLYISAHNILLSSFRRGYNPFVSVYGGSSLEQYLPSRSILFGIKLGF